MYAKELLFIRQIGIVGKVHTTTHLPTHTAAAATPPANYFKNRRKKQKEMMMNLQRVYSNQKHKRTNLILESPWGYISFVSSEIAIVLHLWQSCMLPCI